MHVLILANGTPPGAKLAAEYAAACDLFLATDGAVHKALALGLKPDLVCGDFDSIDMEAAKHALPHTEFIATPDQNRADLEKAIVLAIERGAASITILGANGGRVDHALAGFALLRQYHRAVEMLLVEDGASVTALSNDSKPNTRIFPAHPGDTVSLVALEIAVRVSIERVQWPLVHAELPIGTFGVSNVVTGNYFLLEVHSGTVFVCHLYDSDANRHSEAN